MYLSEEKNDKLFSWKSWSKNELCPKNILLLNFIYQDFRRRKRTSRKTTGTSLCIFIAQTLAEKSQSICIKKKKKKLDLKSAMKRAEPDRNRKRKNVFLSSSKIRVGHAESTHCLGVCKYERIFIVYARNTFARKSFDIWELCWIFSNINFQIFKLAKNSVFYDKEFKDLFGSQFKEKMRICFYEKIFFLSWILHHIDSEMYKYLSLASIFIAESLIENSTHYY